MHSLFLSHFPVMGGSCRVWSFNIHEDSSDVCVCVCASDLLDYKRNGEIDRKVRVILLYIYSLFAMN